jgi:flagellar basal body-associated protein FliL
MLYNVELVLWVDTEKDIIEDLKAEIKDKLNTALSEVENIYIHKCKD